MISVTNQTDILITKTEPNFNHFLALMVWICTILIIKVISSRILSFALTWKSFIWIFIKDLHTTIALNFHLQISSPSYLYLSLKKKSFQPTHFTAAAATGLSGKGTVPCPALAPSRFALPLPLPRLLCRVWLIRLQVSFAFWVSDYVLRSPCKLLD